MKQEIKFRAWHSVQKEMFSPYEMAKDQLTLLPTGKFINVSGKSTSLSEIIETMIPLQYTGLSDKNGVEIYVGDIVLNNGSKWVISHYGGCYRMTLNGIEKPNDHLFIDEAQHSEVIGNVYENPELIEKK